MKGSQTALNTHLHVISYLARAIIHFRSLICLVYGSEVETIREEHTLCVTYTYTVMYSESSSSAFDPSSPEEQWAAIVLHPGSRSRSSSEHLVECTDINTKMHVFDGGGNQSTRRTHVWGEHVHRKALPTRGLNTGPICCEATPPLCHSGRRLQD